MGGGEGGGNELMNGPELSERDVVPSGEQIGRPGAPSRAPTPSNQTPLTTRRPEGVN